MANLEDLQSEVEPEDSYQIWDVDAADEDGLAQFQDVPESAVQPVTDEQLRNDATDATSWLHWNKGLGQTGFSPAEGITPDNVTSLSQAFRIDGLESGTQTVPYVVPSDPPVMYFTEQDYTVHAVNARTGEEFWNFTPESSQTYNSRGSAVYQDLVYTFNFRPEIIALDRYTGEVQWKTDLIMGGQMPGRVKLSTPPTVFDGVLLVGQAGDSGGWTTLSGVDAESGEILWQHRVAPEKRWVGDTWKFSSGAAWMAAAADAETGTAIFSTGNPDPLFNSWVRPGPNKFTDALIAIDAQSGEIKWRHQLFAHESWDYDTVFTPYIFDMEVDGEAKRVVSVDTPTAWSFILDLETGDMIERTKPWAEQGGAFFEYPPKGQENGVEVAPGIRASEMAGMGYSRSTGLRYIGSSDQWAKIWSSDWEFDANEIAVPWGGSLLPRQEDNAAAVSAVDPASGETVWRHMFEDVDPTWASVRITPGGVTPTAGGVVFAGSPGGSLVALNDENGDKLWSEDLGNQIYTSPIVWEDPTSGTPYVSVSVRDGTESSIVTFSADNA